MEVAKSMAGLSTCKRKEVGSIIVTNSFSKIVSIGYNGNYSGGPNTCDTDQVGLCGCLHSEDNCIQKFSPDSGADFIMFLTLSPCVTCAKRIINVHSISTVIYDEEYRVKDGIDLLKTAGKKVFKLSDLLEGKNSL